MKNLKITKILLSSMLVLGLTTSSFAMGHGNKENHDGKVKVEQRFDKKDCHKHEVKVAKDVHHRYHHKHHEIHYSNNNNNDVVAKCIGTGICLAMMAAINS